MLKIMMEYRKGILFIRLKGELDKKTIEKYNKQVITKINKSGIYNIVINIEYLKQIDLKGINTLFYNYECCSKNNGKIFMCGLSNNIVSSKIRKNRLLNYFTLINNEISAFNLVRI